MMHGSTIKTVGDGAYQYVVDCSWDQSRPKILFISGNPSVKKSKLKQKSKFIQDLCAITKSMKKNKKEYGGFYLLNLFAYVKKSNESLCDLVMPAGRENLMYLDEHMDKADLIIPCWGYTGVIWEMGEVVFGLIERDIKRIKKTFFLGLSKNSCPAQNYYPPGNTKLIPYTKRKQKEITKKHFNKNFRKID